MIHEATFSSFSSEADSALFQPLKTVVHLPSTCVLNAGNTV
jgi:hypothetical protein